MLAKPVFYPSIKLPDQAIGVALFNQYAGRNSTGWLPMDNEIETFDIYTGHPQQHGMYHYHLEPLFLTQNSQSKLVGFLSDGFPVYGPHDLGGSLPNDLDECNGHRGTVADYEANTYHYHVTAAFPYISGCYKGTPATTCHFQHGREEGAQQSWTANGTLFSNYVVEDGRRYGLLGSKPCYPVKN